ncbi:Putative phosphoribosylglycinamide synthetase [Elusimicrobium minutum Pei191]|uniref:Putative phosphoribosylglycinamide synthetase n=1 Tax=Elusimicrobium minutum (strain Pei191) TaxID=445932 RepID=B2KDF3_ELUMP|nr:ATP-grasp domain-containing protein [Elusimicrobium minutum]ACC98549.1 Putative phosphoribosylglycinamide synthetase [Elusimicrobium minutum Pei191]
MDKGKVLIVDGYSTGKYYADRLKERGITPFHLTSGMEKNTSLPQDVIEKYIASQIGTSYQTTYLMPDSLQSLLEEFGKHNFAAVIPGTESGVEVAERLSEYFKLPSNDFKTVALRRDKHLMQQALKNAGLKYISFLKTAKVEEALSWIEKNNFKKIVIKPLMSAGTDGVKVCEDKDSVKKAFESLIGTKDGFGRKNDEVLVEQFIEGKEIVVNCVSRGGEHILTDVMIYNKILTVDKNPVYDASLLIKNLTPEFKECVDYTFKVLNVLGIKYGASHTEIMLTPEGPVLIETGARVMGRLSEIYWEALGRNSIDLILDSYLDGVKHKENMLKPYNPKKSFLYKYFISYANAEISSLPVFDSLGELPCVRELTFALARQSMRVKKTIDMPTMPGEGVFISEQEEEIINAYKTARFLEVCAPGLLYEPKDAVPMAFEKELLAKIKDKGSLCDEYDTLFKGFELKYKDFENSVLYVLNDLMLPCLNGEIGDVYIAGKQLYEDKRTKETLIPNPFYSVFLPVAAEPFLFKTGDKGRIEKTGEIKIL